MILSLFLGSSALVSEEGKRCRKQGRQEASALGALQAVILPSRLDSVLCHCSQRVRHLTVGMMKTANLSVLVFHSLSTSLCLINI